MAASARRVGAETSKTRDTLLDHVEKMMLDEGYASVTDRGLARQVPQAHWDTLVGGMREAFRGGRFVAGVEQAVDAVDAMLVRHFPLAEGQQNPNELPDRAHLG